MIREGKRMPFTKNDIKIDAAKETERIAKEMRRIVGRDFRKQGAVALYRSRFPAITA